MSKDRSTPADPAQSNWLAFHRAWPSHGTYIHDAKRYSDFYLGEQWDEGDRSALESEGRPALTVNQCLAVINAVRGRYGEARADIQYLPKKGPANQELASTLTRLTDHILEANDFTERVEPQVFEDGLIEDRGFFDVRVDFTENPYGEVRIRDLNPRSVIPDPEAQSYDPNDWNEVIITRWMTLDEIESYYGKKIADKVEGAAYSDYNFGAESVMWDTYGDDSPSYLPSQEPSDSGTIRAVRVIERQYRTMSRVEEFVDPVTGETAMVPEDWDEDTAAMRAEQHGLKRRKNLRPRVRWTVSADRVVLHDDWSPYDTFTVIPYYPMFRRGRPSGLMRHLVDPQEQLNKIESQVLHVINTTANSGWVVQEGSLLNMTTEELEERGAESGLVLSYARNAEPPQKIEPNAMPHGLESYAQKAGHYIQAITGVQALLAEQPKAAVSGVALEQSHEKSLMGLQVVFDNLDFTRKLIGRKVLECVQKYYTEERVFHITEWRSPEMPQQEVVVNQQDAAGQVVNDITVGTYEVVAGSSPTRKTFEERQFAQIVELRKAGVMIPDHHVILNSQLANRQEIAEQVKQMQGLGEPDEAQQKMQQLEMQRKQLEVQELQAKVEELQTRAQHQMARAQTELAGEEREAQENAQKLMLEVEKLRAELAKHQSDVRKDLQITEMHNERAQSLERYSKNMESHERQLDRENEQALEAARQQVDLTKEALRSDQQQKQAEEQTRREGLKAVLSSEGSDGSA